MDIYLDKSIKLNKIAGAETRLTDDAEKWPVQVASMLHKSLPFLSNYAVHIELDKVDNERGYAYGTAKVSNRYELESKDKREVVIPIIVKDRMLKPFDIFIVEEKTKPLTQEALNSFLFRTSTVEMTNRKPTDKDTSMQWSAPTDRFSAYGNMRGRSSGAGGSSVFKMASMLEVVTPSAEYVDRLSNTINNSIELKTALFSNPAFTGSIDRILSKKPVEEVEEEIEPSVVQFEKLGKYTFKVSYANNEAFEVREKTISTKVASAILGDLAYTMNPNTALTVINNPVEEKELVLPEQIKTAGYFDCIDVKTQKVAKGLVVKVGSFLGDDKWLFVGSNSCAIQDNIIGIKTAEHTDISLKNEGNFGVFSGESWTSEPLSINHQIGQTFYCKTANMDIRLIMNDDVIVPAKIASGTWLIPRSNFVGLPTEGVQLEDNLNTVTEQIASKIASTALQLTRIDDLYLVKGAAVSKLNLRELNEKQAQFVLGACGISLPELENGETKIFNSAHDIYPKSLITEAVTKEANELQKNWTDISVDLLKTAALLQDGDTIDNVLSLGMITPDTIVEFINGIPSLEDTSDKLADLLLHIRVGMSTVPEMAVEACMRNLVSIIKKLKELKDQGVTD